MSVRAMSTWRFPPPLLPAANESWPAAYWLVMLAMWWVMMIAMMVPSAAPAILVYARVARHARKEGQAAAAVAPTAWFAAGYLLAWLAFSIAAVLVQWGLERLGLAHMMMMWSLDTSLSAAILLAAGLYQLSPFKDRCLRSCRMPAEFLARNWRPGIAGAVRLGAAHGLYCVGCCAMLMALLFAGGIMNLVWIVGLSGLVLAEKLLPAGRLLARFIGIALIAGGAYVLATA
jgi:predicted metal-binding membrane protein